MTETVQFSLNDKNNNFEVFDSYTEATDALTAARSLRSPPAASYKVGSQSVVWKSWLVIRPRFFNNGDQMNEGTRTPEKKKNKWLHLKLDEQLQ